MKRVENSTYKGNESLLGSFYIILSAILYGLMPLMTKTIIAHGGNAYTSAFLCFAMGAVFLWPVLIFKEKETIRIERFQLVAVLGLSCFHALTLGLLYSSYAYISSGLATTLHFTYPAAVILLELVLFRLLPTRRELISLMLAIAGVILMNSRSGETNMIGMLLALLSGIAYALYISLYGHSRAKGLSALVMSFWINAFAAAELCVFISATGKWQLPKI